MASVIECRETLRNDSLCFFCQNQCFKAKQLPCDHSYCENCLRDYISRCLNSDKTFSCPSCHSKILLTANGVNDFPSISVLNSLDTDKTVAVTDSMFNVIEQAITSQSPRRATNDNAKYKMYLQGLSQVDVSPCLYPNLENICSLSPSKRNALKASIPVKYDNFGCMYAFGHFGEEIVDFNDPVSIVVSSSGLLFISDRHKNRIMMFDKGGKILRLFATDGNLGCICLDNNNLLLTAEAEAGKGLFYRYDTNGVKKGSFGCMFSFEKSHGITFDSVHCHIIISTLETNMVYVLDSTGKLVNKFGGKGKGDRRFMSPLYVSSNQKGQILVVDSDNHCIKVFSSACKYLFSMGSSGSGLGQLENPRGICVDRWDNVIVCDYGNARLQLFDKAGKFLVEMTRFPLGYHPKDVAYEVHSNRLFILLTGLRKAEVRVCDYYSYNPAKDVSGSSHLCT